MQRRSAPISQAQIVRVLKAAREAGVREVTMQYREVKITFCWADETKEWSKAKATEKKRPLSLL